MRCVGHVAQMGEKKNAYRILVGKPEGKRPLGRPRHRWVDNIKINFINDPETKQPWSQWKSPQSPRAKKVQQVRSSTKSMLIVFSTRRGFFTMNLFLLTLQSTLIFTVTF
jgi:hypothetical protein